MTRRISRRLNQLESSSESESINCDTTLVELLGRRDALHWPRRDYWGEGGASNYGPLMERRRLDLKGKQGFSAKASGAADWKLASERRALLITRGQAKAVRTAGGEIGGLRLTRQGEADARALVGPALATLATEQTQIAWELLNRWFDQCILREWFRGCWHSHHSAYVSESRLFGRMLVGDPTEWEHLTELMLPLITAGYVHSCCDYEGRIYYSPSTTSKGQLIGPRELPPPPDSRYEADPEMEKVYFQAFNEEQTVLDKLEESAELGTIIVPCSAFIQLQGEGPAEWQKLLEASYE